MFTVEQIEEANGRLKSGEDLDKMTYTYYDSSGNEILTEIVQT